MVFVSLPMNNRHFPHTLIALGLAIISTLLLPPASLRAQTQDAALWSEIDEATLPEALGAPGRSISPRVYSTLRLDPAALARVLATVPAEGASTTGESPALAFEVVLPDGRREAFYLTEYAMLEPGLARQFPTFRTFHGRGADDPGRRIRVDWTANGLNAMLHLPEGLAFVRPYRRGDTLHYLSYYERDLPAEREPFECGTLDEKAAVPPPVDKHGEAARAGDCQLRTYRLAVAVTGEYATSTLGASSAGTAADDATVTAHIVTSINQINAWYERDITARFVLIANLADIFYYNGTNDPYTNSDASAMLDENRDNLNAVIGLANYDLGHVLGNSGGSSGVAQLNALCSTNKARGVTRASSAGINAPRFLKVWAHEMGHQFGAGHTQNEDCQRSSTSAMEPGAGTTIMSYVTSNCANQIQSVPDYYFHAISLQQMSARMLATSCATILPSPNAAPVIVPGLDRTVPSSTPLRLVATATDPNNDPLTYTWEQFDNEPAQAIPPQPTNTLGPSFRSLPPSASNERYLPNLSAVLAGTTPTWEVLPSVARVMDFRVTVRDNSTNQIGCTTEDDIRITTVASGPFAVVGPSGANTIWSEGTVETVTWSVAGTNAAPVSCATVDILLSYNGGLTYPVTLASAVPNTGSAGVFVPTGTSNSARVLVRCASNIFYNVSAANFKIQLGGQPTFTLGLNSASATICPGDPVTVPIIVNRVAGFSGSVALATSNLPAGATAAFTNTSVGPGASSTLTISNTAALAPGAYTFGIVGTNGATVRTVNFSLTVNAGAGTIALDAPADNASGIRQTPALSWAPNPGASTYTVQVASSPTFATPTVNATANQNTYSVTPGLQPQTTYYWRVRGTTACGTTPWSAVRSFTTGSCLAALTQNTPVSISATGTPTVTSVLTVNAPGTVSTLTVSNVTGSHTYMSDLDVDLIAPGGSPVVRLWTSLCGTGNDFSLSLDDAAGTSVTAAPCNPLGQGGTFQPEGALSAFQGIPLAGDWTLRIADNANQDGGTLTSWTLNFCTPGSAPLPVEWLTFGAAPAGRAIRLDWSTARERDNAGFTVERRSTDTDFVAIGTVDAAAGDGGPTEYTFLDEAARPATRYYYRLRQVDRDGQSNYSSVTTAVLEAEAVDLRVHPNPTRGTLRGSVGEGAGGVVQLRVLDIHGRVVRTASVTGSRFEIDLAGVPAGVYVLQSDAAGSRGAIRVVVE